MNIFSETDGDVGIDDVLAYEDQELWAFYLPIREDNHLTLGVYLFWYYEYEPGHSDTRAKAKYGRV